MHKDVQSNGNWIGFKVKAGDMVSFCRNDEVMCEFIVPYDDAEISSYLKRMTRPLEVK